MWLLSVLCLILCTLQWEAIEQAIELIRQSGGTVHYPIELTHPSEISFNGGPGYLKVLCESPDVRL